MGMLIDGQWISDEGAREDAQGRYLRTESTFRDRITADGSSGFKAEPGRYHLYVSLGCPWASRTVIYRKLKGLENAISLSVVDPTMRGDGWEFSDAPGCTSDPVLGASYLREIYLAAKSDFTGRVTVPVLWDNETGTIVNNESSEIIRMLDGAFDGLAETHQTYLPEPQRDEIDAINAVTYETVNNGVYKCGFATTQDAYEAAYGTLFATLDELEARLAHQRYLVGARTTEADWRLFPTLARFDAVYFSLFKCNRQRIADYPNLANYTRDLYQVPGVAETVDLDHIKRGYWGSMRKLNPTGIVPKGPGIDFAQPHDRDRFVSASAA